MDRRRRGLLIQVGLGLSVGVIVPLTVVGVLLFMERDGDAETVRIAPTPEAAQAPRGLRVTQGKELERYLLTKEDLGTGWAVFDSPGGGGGQGTLDGAVSSVPDIPTDCANFQSSRFRAFRTPAASTYLYNPQARRTLFQTIYVFRPGMAVESMAYLRGLIARCGKYEEKIRIQGRVVGGRRVAMTAGPGPRLGDESLRTSSRVTYSGRIGGQPGITEVYVRVGDTVLYCNGTGDLDDAVRRAFDKIT